MRVGGDHFPIVARPAVERAGIAGRAGCVVADQVVRRCVVGLQVDVIGDGVAGVWVAAAPAEVDVYALVGCVVGWRGGRGDVGRVVASPRW